MSFQENLRAYRLQRGYTQQDVADRLGVTKSTYCGYETGKRKPDVAKIKELARILGCSADVLLGTQLASPTASGVTKRQILEWARNEASTEDLAEFLQILLDRNRANG